MISGIRTHIRIGAREVLRCPGLWIESERHKPLSRAQIKLNDPAGEIFRDVEKGEAVEIRLGYRNETPASWTGTVVHKGHGRAKYQLMIGAVGADLPLSTALIMQSWQDETPEAIIRWALGRAGMTAGRIDSPGVTIGRFSASNIPVWQVARQCAQTCHRAFGIDMSRWALWLAADGTVCWGDFDEAGDTPVIATGAGLIRHQAVDSPWACSLSRVETFLLAGFRHSQTFRLVDTRRGIDAEYRALRVRHAVTPQSARTDIWYGEEFEPF